MIDPSHYVGTNLQVGNLHIRKVLNGLTEQEKKYSAYLTLAGWSGYPILNKQISRNSYSIYEFLSEFILTYPKEKLIEAVNQKNSPLFYLVEFAAAFFYNSGEYEGFGDTKMYPRVTKEELKEIVKEYPKLKELLDKCIDKIYDVDLSIKHIGFNPGGHTAYYSPDDFSQEEEVGIDNLLRENNVRVENTIIIRHNDKYEVSIASINVNEPRKIGEFRGLPVFVTTGRDSETLKKTVHWLTLAKECASREGQKEMLEALIQHYTTGDILLHEKYSRLWVNDVNPNVETYQGFIESYRDPAGVRCEYEAFIAAVDHEESKAFHDYVEASKTILGLMPYPKEYERGVFIPPSYNSIDILSFCTSGMPIGINIPNYDDIRLNYGFKNVTLGNVFKSSCSHASDYIFLNDSDAELVVKNVDKSFTVHVASHELYGHGSGKLLYKKDVEGKNIPDMFDPTKKIETYYPDGASFDSIFGSTASSYEECRAETTGLYLTFQPEVLKIFGVKPEEYDDISYANLISLLHSGIKQMNCYSPETSSWKQAHARARFAILRACIMWSNGAVEVKTNEKGEYKLNVDRKKIKNIYSAIVKLLKYLNYYKTTCQSISGIEFYRSLTSIDEFWLPIREQATKKKIPRKLICGAIINNNNGDYSLEDPIAEGATPTVFDVAYSIAKNIKESTSI